MVTMPIAGSLADRVPVGRIVPVAIATIVAGITGLALSTDPDTPYWRVILFLFVMGLGMGGSMMPIFTSALRTLREHQIARGTTLINVIQQVASSVGVAVMSVVLTNRQNASEAINAFGAIGEAKRKGVHAPAWATDTANRLGDAFQSTVLSDRAHSFATTYWVAAAALVVTLATSALLPRKHAEQPPEAGEKDRVAPPAALH
jgi:MFS family permease